MKTTPNKCPYRNLCIETNSGAIFVNLPDTLYITLYFFYKHLDFFFRICYKNVFFSTVFIDALNVLYMVKLFKNANVPIKQMWDCSTAKIRNEYISG